MDGPGGPTKKQLRILGAAFFIGRLSILDFQCGSRIIIEHPPISRRNAFGRLSPNSSGHVGIT